MPQCIPGAFRFISLRGANTTKYATEKQRCNFYEIFAFAVLKTQQNQQRIHLTFNYAKL